MKTVFGILLLAILATACGDARQIDCIDGCSSQFYYTSAPATPVEDEPTDDSDDKEKKPKKDKEDHGKDK